METCLYTGRVSHSRFRPRAHRFTYDISMVMVDIERLERGVALDSLPGWLRLLLPLRRRDHCKNLSVPEQTPVRATLQQTLTHLVKERADINLDSGGRVFLLTGLGFLRHRFNPASFYYCYDSSGRLECIVAEVTNTPWHEQSHYVLDPGGQDRQNELHFRCAKNFHVSPFMPMDTHYQWRMVQHQDHLLISIGVERKAQPLFNATLDIEQRPLTPFSLISTLARQPLMSISVTLRIYWQALRLWVKSTPFFSHPQYGSGDK